MSERTDIQTPIIRRLADAGYLVLRINGGRRGNISFYHWWDQWGQAQCSGISDIIGLSPNGRMIAIEVKLPGKKRTAEQIRFQDCIARRGGLVAVVDIPDWQPPPDWQ